MRVNKTLFLRLIAVVLCTVIISGLCGCGISADKKPGEESGGTAYTDAETVNNDNSIAATDITEPQETESKPTNLDSNTPEGTGQTSVLTFNAIAGVALDHSKPDANLGTAINIAVRGYTVEEGSTEPVPDREIWGLFKFEVTGISGDVTGAKIKLYNMKNRKEPFYGSTAIYAVSESSWEQSDVTWNSMPECGELVGKYDNPPSDYWIETDVTPLIKGDGTYSVMIKSDAGYAYVILSQNGHDPDFYPALEIEITSK